MAGKQVVKHIHKLKKHTHTNKEAVYFCVLDCPYKINVALSLGKANMCWRCGKTFNLNEYALRLVKPNCPECKKIKTDIKMDDLEIKNADKITDTDDLLSRLRKTIEHSGELEDIEESEDSLL